MKYVCFLNQDTGVEEVIMFPKHIHHKCFAEANDSMKDKSHGDWKREYRIPVSAGFVMFTKDGLFCYGESESLHKASRPQDTTILNNQLS